MSRRDRDRLRDIAAACTAISRYIDRSDADDEIVFDATHAIVTSTARNDIPELADAVERLLRE